MKTCCFFCTILLSKKTVKTCTKTAVALITENTKSNLYLFISSFEKSVKIQLWNLLKRTPLCHILPFFTEVSLSRHLLRR